MTETPDRPVERWKEFSLYGADGIPGGVAIARQLDERASNRIPSADTDRGLQVRLRYLTWNDPDHLLLRRAGITATARTVRRWKAGVQRPNPANLRAVDEAFWSIRCHALADLFKSRLWQDGSGTSIEIHPVDQSQVGGSRRRSLNLRRINIRYEWAAIVDAWLAGDTETLTELWRDLTSDLGSDGDAYLYVSHIGFGV